MSTITKQVMSNSGIEALTDHYAKMWYELKAGIVNASPDTSADQEAYRIITAEDNAYSETTLGSAAKTLDENGISNSVLASTVFGTVCKSHDTHVKTVTGVSSNTLDTLLTNSGINVSSDYEEVYYYSTGRHLSANNTYYQGEYIVGAVNSTSSGVGSFTDGDAIGIGSGSVSADGNTYAAAQLKCIVTSGIGSNDLLLKLHVTEEDTTETTINVTIGNALTVGDEVEVGTSSNKYIDVTNIEIAGGNNGDGVIVKNIPERTLYF